MSDTFDVELKSHVCRCVVAKSSGDSTAGKPRQSGKFCEITAAITGNVNTEQLSREYRGNGHCIHTFNGPLSGTTRVSRYQKGKTSEWQ